MLPDPAAMGVFLVATVALNLTPGPDMLYVIANGVGRGRKAGVVSAIGIGAGTVVHTAAAAVGLSALLMSSALGYEMVRYAGAAYLLYLAYRTFRGTGGVTVAGPPHRGALAALFRQGVVTNVLNPKVALFFLAFLPQFVDPSRGEPVWQFLFLGTLFNISGTLVNTAVAVASGSLGGWIQSSPVASGFQRWFSGGVFLALGARLALTGQR